MAFNRPFARNGRSFNRGGNNNFRGGNNFRNNNQQQQDPSEQLPLRGIAWGNKFRDKQRAGAPVLQGYITDAHGQKFRLVGFINPAPDHRENAEAQEYKEQIAAELNAILIEAQEAFGIAFNITLQDEEEWKAERDNASRGNSQGAPPRQQFRGATPARGASPRQAAPQNVPFNQQGEDYGQDPEPEPEASPRPASTKPRTRAAKPAPAKRATKRGK